MCSLARVVVLLVFTSLLNLLSDEMGCAQSVSDQQPADTLGQLSLDAAEDHQPITEERFAVVHQELVDRVRSLERALGGNSAFAAAWKRYLEWDLLAPQLQPNPTINRTTLENLDSVLRRFRSNYPGLELPVFRRTAAALRQYRDVAFWHALAARRDIGPLYQAYLRELSKQLERHATDPTMETTRQIGKAIGTIEMLGDSPRIVEAVRARYSQPNVWADVSSHALNQLAAPVCRLGPVRDCILGATVRGTALTSGHVSFQPYKALDRIELDIRVNGTIHSNTNSYRKPVRIHSTGTTPYTASKRVLISDEYFATASHTVSAHTHTHIQSVNKTGGRFGKRLVERIAWKKVYESKSQSEWIASRHAERQILDNLNQQIIDALANGRASYVSKLRAPLTRIDLLADVIHLSSRPQAIQTQVLLASYNQIATQTLPPAHLASNDITLQLHESAINNYLPTALGGAMLRQQSADQPPKLSGSVPPWLKKLAAESPQKLSAPPAESTTRTTPPEGPFRPWYFKFNSEQPVSVSFRDQQLVLRMRLAEIQASDDPNREPLKNWDFLVTYRIDRRGDEVMLQRAGQVEAFPTGFDPRWDTSLTGEQVGIRNNLQKNLNKRAAEGQGFPAEIRIPAIKLPQAGGRQAGMQLTQLECNNGWLTLGYRVF